MNTKSNYNCITIAAPDHVHEFIIAEIMDYGFDSFEEKDNQLICFIEQKLFTATVEEELGMYLQSLGNQVYIESQEVLEPRNWNEEWEQNIQAVDAGKFFIRPSWRADLKPADSAIVLEIDPKMAFGTGYHETTRLMLRKIGELDMSEKTVLDVGTGTGVLAIACLKIGAKDAFGFDIDEWSFENATENALMNGVTENFKVASGSFETVPPHTEYEVVLANLQRHIILSNDKALLSCTKKGGDLLLSGILAEEEKSITQHPLFTQNFTLSDVQKEGEWIMVHFSNRK